MCRRAVPERRWCSLPVASFGWWVGSWWNSLVGSRGSGSRETDQVVAGQRSTDLLHPAALTQAAEVNYEEAGVLEQRYDLGLRVAVVAREEDHTLAARLVRVGAEYGGDQRVGGLHHTRGGNELGDHLTGCASVQVAGVEVVGWVDHDPPIPLEALDGLRNVLPHHCEHDDVRRCGLL